MKKFLLLAFVLIGNIHIKAQSTCQPNYAYDQQYYIADIPHGESYPKYDNYGNYIGHFQQFNKAHWHSAFGPKMVRYATSYGWRVIRRTGPYYRFNWVVYEKKVGYYQPTPTITRRPIIVPNRRPVYRYRRPVRRYRVRNW